MRGQIKTSVTRNITLTLVHFQRLRARMLQITFQRWTKAYSEERHRKRFPSPHCFMPFYRGTPSWKPEPPQPVVSGVSRKLPTKTIKSASFTSTPRESHVLEQYRDTRTIQSSEFTCKCIPTPEIQGNIWQKLYRTSRPLY